MTCVRLLSWMSICHAFNWCLMQSVCLSADWYGNLSVWSSLVDLSCIQYSSSIQYFAILLRLSSLNIFVIHSVGLSCISFVCHAFNCVTCSQSVCHLLILFFIKSVCLPCIQTVCQTVSLFVWQSVCLSGKSVCLSGSQSVCQAVSPFVWQSVCLSGIQSVCQAVSLFVTPVSLFVRQSVLFSVQLVLTCL